VSTAISPDRITVVAATSLEARAVRRHCGGVRVVESGVALSHLRGEPYDTAISCGLAGGLRNDLPTGTVLVPQEVHAPDGSVVRCDPELVASLHAAAVRLGYAPIDAPLLTTESIATGVQRTRYAVLGYAGVDMETALIPATRLAAVRVILDTPLRELSPEWLHPVRAFLRPSNWPQAFWLAREAPRCATLAASIVGAAFP
jgi:nucleoside phosphorylase